jgi:hypothetical protein
MVFSGLPWRVSNPWLAAAGDFLGADYFVAEPFQNFDHADAGAWIECVHEAGDEKRDRHVCHQFSATGAG